MKNKISLIHSKYKFLLLIPKGDLRYHWLTFPLWDGIAEEFKFKLTVLPSDWPGLVLELCGSLLVTWSHVAYSCSCLSSINNGLNYSVKIIGISCQNISLKDGWIILKNVFGDIEKWRSPDFSGCEISAVRLPVTKSGVLLHVTLK
jgi:hypothetical protein